MNRPHVHSPPRSRRPGRLTRRSLLGLGGGALGAGLLSGCNPTGGTPETNPLGIDFAAAMEPAGELEQRNVTVGFVPITCSSPIINAAAMGIFEQYGLNVTLQRYTGWGELWIAFVAGELDATQMLIPMPLGIHHNFAAGHRATRLPYITNTNGQAITLGLQHEGRVNGPEDFEGLTLAVPFDYSGHNLLLRDYLALGGLDPDYDVGIQVMRPSDMVAALNVGDIDGFLAPDPFNQRAVAIGAGYLYTLSKELWDGHPCCSFAVADEFAAANPNTYATLLRAIGDSAMWTDQPDHRSLAAETMAGRAFLSQDPAVLDAVLSGNYEDGTGQELSVEDRIGFQPYPHESYAIWALTQLQRWDLAPTEGYDSAEDYQSAVREVLDPDTAVPILEELGADTSPRETETIIGRTFDPADPLPWTSKQVNV
ncbi:ABC transporter substrate-binding protein [Nesterenkonia salmonea]|uniref:ABC transporter substrate-binding protein n=1 Tax=Nesterenkonia salmonea TaxID=1804987 RepID=A0A5R9B8X3_9MICC|nr:ABC transporter substrate-binding protein [Nesterenkonia salmonea]TLP92592.1 ABC transporter substrate-binding protein [Nesterenkonia salmonea]